MIVTEDSQIVREDLHFFAQPSNAHHESVVLDSPSVPIKTYVIDSHTGDLAADWHWHDEGEFIGVLDGTMEFSFEGGTQALKAGDMLFINGRTAHQSQCVNDQYLRIVLLQFPMAAFFEADRIPGVSTEATLAMARPTAWMHWAAGTTLAQDFSDNCIAIATELTHKQPAYELMIRSRIFKTLAQLIRSGGIGERTASNPGHAALLAKINPVLRWMVDHLHENLTVEDARQLAGCSYHHFCHVFQKATGSTFVELLNKLRLQQVERLLLTTDLSITAISEQTGFSSLSYFNRVFRNHKQQTPSAFRQRVRRVAPSPSKLKETHCPATTDMAR